MNSDVRTVTSGVRSDHGLRIALETICQLEG
jgi:hypothetical protein